MADPPAMKKQPNLTVDGLRRRHALFAFGVAGLLPACTTASHMDNPHASDPEDRAEVANLQRDLNIYQRFGRHRSGSAADLATAEWLSTGFASIGYEVTRLPLPVDNHDQVDATLAVGPDNYSLLAQPPFLQEGRNQVEGRLSYLGPTGPRESLSGRLIVADAPYDRASSYSSPAYRALANIAINHNARGLILITNGPSQEATWLNTSPDQNYPLTALCAPKNANPLRDLAIQGRSALLSTPPRMAKRTAYSLVARLERGPKQIVVSTPYSGWTEGAGERGPGVATLRALARWLRYNKTDHSVTLIATSGHEQGDLGMRGVLARAAPMPDTTDIWFHLGAGFAARDWYETPIGLVPMKSADAQRYLLASSTMRSYAETAFKRIPGLETVHALSPETAAGELKMIAETGYENAIGMFGAHRFHHTDMDTSKAVFGELVAPVALSVRRLLSRI